MSNQTQPTTVIDAPPTINSVVMVQFTTTTSPVSASLSVTTEKINAQNNSDSATVRTKTFETKGTPVGDVKTIIDNAAKDIKSLCLPCPQLPGLAYVKAKDVSDIQTIFDDAEAMLIEAKQEVVNEWDDLLAAAQKRMGNFKDEVELPCLADFIEGFSIDLVWSAAPAPVNGTVLESLSTEVAARIKAASEKSVDKRIVDSSAQVVRELINMLLDSIEKIPKAKRIRRERFDNLKAQVDKIKDLNWGDNPQLDALYEKLSSKLTPVLEDVEARCEDSRGELVKHIKDAKDEAATTLNSLGL